MQPSMLKETDISIFDSPAQTLVNTVNTVGVMGKGIAKDFKLRYPDMFKRYMALCDDGSLQVGKLYLYTTPHHWVLNFPTKKHWRHPSKAEWIDLGLQKFVATYGARGITSISFPQLGCGNGGLDWESVVRPMMVKHLGKLPIPVYVHVARLASKFVPEHLEKNQLQTFRSELQQGRESISFEKFFQDIQAAGGIAPAATLPEPDPDELQALPVLSIHVDGLPLRVTGDDLADLWHTLLRRRAIAVSELPGELGDHWKQVLALLLRLEYIEPMSLQGHDGVRLAPPPESKPALASVARES